MENLESRDCPTIYGIFYEGMYHVLNTNPFSYSVSDKPILYGTNNADEIQIIGDGFTVYGLGGNDTIIGSESVDNIFGGDGDDVIIGNGGTDFLYGENGVDYLVSDNSVVPQWTGELHERVLAAKELVFTQDGGTNDGGNGFNMVNHEYTYGVQPTIVLSAGTYNWGDYKPNGVALVGLGEVIFVGTRFDAVNTYLENINIDITGLSPYPQGYVNSFTGNSVLNKVEVYGQNTTNTSAVYFNAKIPTQAIIMNSYVHDTFGDGISTGGSQGTSSLLQLFSVRGERSGPAENNQVLTAHQGFNVVDVGGTYSDACSNVIAPDSNTQIFLNYTTVSKGARMAGVQLNSPSRIYKSTLYDQYTLNVGYEISHSNIYTHSFTTTYFMTIQATGKVKNCYIKKMGTSANAYRNMGEITDTVFEGWV